MDARTSRFTFHRTGIIAKTVKNNVFSTFPLENTLFHTHCKIQCLEGGAHESDKSQDFHGMVTMEILQDFLCMVIHGMSHKKNVSNLPLKKLG